MNSDELRRLQAPLKSRYRENPDSALVTMSVRGQLGEAATCRVETAGGVVVAGLHPATGGDGTARCSAEMLLEALVGCAGVTLNAVATSMGVAWRSATIEAEGMMDFRGTLGVSREVPVGFQSIRLTFRFDSDASHEQLAKLVELTERYCVVYQTLKSPPSIQAVIARV
ncbi:MAG TPA: OsmC family protein [Candidatus Didemnitutus sp.]|nr:OsmC family protein [Candidatus Didemnitutus sp.]